MIELRAIGLIYRDSTLHAWHPTLALLPSGDLLAELTALWLSESLASA